MSVRRNGAGAVIAVVASAFAAAFAVAALGVHGASSVGAGGPDEHVAWRSAARQSVGAAQPGEYRFSGAWPVADGEPIAVAARPDGGVVVAVAPLVAQPSDFAALRFVDANLGLLERRVPRDEQGRAIQPLALVVGAGGALFAASADRLVAYDGTGGVVWDRPAGDGHPDFGPAARGLAAAGDRLYGVDMANARLLGYDGATGQLRQRLGTAGTGASSYLAPLDVAMLSDGRRVVADHGNRRLALSDADGNPLARWPLPDRPIAVARTSDDIVLTILADDSVYAMDGQGAPIARFARFGRGPGELRGAADIAVGPDGRVWIADRGNRRVALFAPPSAASPAPGASSTPPSATPLPSESAPASTATPTPMPDVAPSTLAACPGKPAQLTLDVALPPVAPRLDLVLLFDTTGSMEAVVSTARARALEMAARLRGLAPDVAIAVGDVRDMPYGAAGQATDWPWRLRGALSTEPDDLAAAAGELWAGGGGDEPEAYSLALRDLIDDERVGWRPGARRVIALFGDSVPRDDDLNAGVAGAFVPSPWTPGLPKNWRDSGPDWAPYSADDLDWQSVLLDLRDRGVTLVAGVTGTAPGAVRGRPDVLTAYWRDWTARTGPGGGAVEIAAAGQLPDALATLVAGTGRRIGRLNGAVEPPLFASWVTWTPTDHTDIDVPAGGARRTFDARIEPPAQTPDGTFDLTLYAMGDGARYDARPVRLAWRRACGPTAPPTPTAATPTATATVEGTDIPPPTATAAPSATATPTVQPTPTPTRTALTWPSPSPTPRTTRVYLPILERSYCDPSRRPIVQVALAIDTSSSMAGDKLAAAIAAARLFVDLINLPRDQAAVITFDSTARVVQPLSSSRPRVRASLADLTTGIGTRLDKGIDAASAALQAGARPGARQIVVLLTDGQPDGGTEAAALAVAESAKAAGIAIFAVGLGDDAAGDLLAKVASDASLYRVAPSAEELGRVYEGIAGDVGCR